ncbi:MAG: hypothetical protein LBI33_00820 [Propionibacteriaceae bacterium]|jgi:alpha-beta hydrolase superfamily lysophospholipase|nr:hypothetical protein [Propionibacteriaceae bacterium]
MLLTTEVSWVLDGMTMFGTVVRPEGAGPFPGVIMVAGSGPTDRDWCSPLLPGTNGSARLLAEALAAAGIASLRYDKRASGPHVRENVPAMMGRISMAFHLDELVAAVNVLAGQDFVDPSRLAGLGNSEGTLHVLHYATTPQAHPFAGIVLAAPPGRAVGQLLRTQLAAQFAQVEGGDALMALVEASLTRYEAGEPMNPDPGLPEPIRQLLASFETPLNLPFARELWSENAGVRLVKATLPTLVIIGGKDIQVDTHLDGDPLQAAAAGMSNVVFAFPPNANHVLKAETRNVAEAIADPHYNEADTHLDPEALHLILDWLGDLFR